MNSLNNGILLISTLFFSLICFSPVQATETKIPVKGPVSFSMYDLNGDGLILEEEFVEVRNKRMQERVKQGYQMRNRQNLITFSSIDLDKDGKITPGEFSTHRSKRFKLKQARSVTNNTAVSGNLDDPRILVSMPTKAQNMMRKDMQINLITLNSIIASLASGDFESASNLAEQTMGKAAMGKHRGSGAAPGRFMTAEMRSLGWAMHDSASEFASVAKKKDINKALKALEKLTNSCIACHSTYRIR